MHPILWAPLCAASSLAFGLLQWRLSPRLCHAHFPVYASPSRLTEAQRREWDSRVVSTLNALLAALVWLLAWVIQPAGVFVDPDRVGGNCSLVSVAFIIMSGYMLSDGASMLAYMGWREMVAYQLHHCLAFITFVATAWHGTLHYFSLFRVASELSTPLLNLMWLFRVSDYRKVAPVANALNSAALTVTFACCRILPIPIYWARVAAFLADSGPVGYMHRFPVIGPCWIAISLALDCLNLIWFRKLILGGLKLLRSERSPARGVPAAAAAGTRDTSE